MRIFAFAALLAIGLLGGMVPASAQPDEGTKTPYYASGPWTVLDRAKIFCAIEHIGDDTGRLLLSKSSTEPAYFNFKLNTPIDYHASSAGVVWRFDDEELVGRILAGTYYQLPDKDQRVDSLFRSSATLTIIDKGEPVATIDLTGSAAAYAQLEQCAGQYPDSRVPLAPPPPPPFARLKPYPVTAIEAPPRVRNPDLRRPMPSNRALQPISPSLWISKLDYPEEAARKRQQGTVRVDLIVGPNGRVTQCAITQSSGSMALDDATCRTLEHNARFDPATDAEGNPVSAPSTITVPWVISQTNETLIPPAEID